ncbi:MAG: hypothetical protein ACT4QG_14790 [Sporichthyaceae bacterium]
MSSTSLTTHHVVRARSVRRAVSHDVLWAPTDRLVAGILLLVGSAPIPIAWVGASGTTQWDTQLRWTALAMVGVVVVCIGVGVWLYRGFVRVRAEARALRGVLRARLAEPAVRPGTPGGGLERVTVTGMAHHHRPDCLLVVGKPVHPATEDLAPCGVCA